MPTLMIRSARLSFGKLFTPDAYVDPATGKAGKPKFSAHFILDLNDPQVAAIRAAIEQAAVEKWKDKAKAMLAAMDGKNKCLRDGNTMLSKAGDVYSQYVDRMYINASNAAQPLLIDQQRAPLVEAHGRLYDGCYVNAQVDIYGYDSPGHSRAVYASLLGVQLVKTGDAFSAARVSSTDAFDELPVEDSDPLA